MMQQKSRRRYIGRSGSGALNGSPIRNPQYHQIVGQLITQWANFEQDLILTFQALSGHGDQLKARIAWAALPNLRARRLLLSRYIETYITAEAVLKEWRALEKRMSKVAAKRNLVAHAVSGWSDDLQMIHFGKHAPLKDELFVFKEDYWETMNNVKQWPAAVTALNRDLRDLLPRLKKAMGENGSRRHHQHHLILPPKTTVDCMSLRSSLKYLIRRRLRERNEENQISSR